MTAKGQMSPSRQAVREIQASQNCLSAPSVSGDYGANPHGDHLHAHEGQESDWEQDTWIHQRQMVPGQPDCPF